VNRTRAFIGLGCLLAGIAVPAGASGVPSPVLRVEGLAGSSYWVQVAPGTQLGNADDYTTAVGGHAWSGIALVRPSRAAGGAQVFVSVDLPESVRCPGGHCPWEAPPPDLTSDEDANLAPGRYRLVLLGAPGTRVSAVVRPGRGRVSWSASRHAPAVRLTAALTTGQGPAGHQTALHDFHSMPGGHGFGVIWSVQYLAVDPVGLMESAVCITDGPNDTAVASLGGIAPCADTKGIDVLGPAAVGPTSVAPLPGYAPVNAAAAGVYGPQDDRPSGVGWDASLVAPASYLGDVFVGFALPF
jgi:hypothetical protein